MARYDNILGTIGNTPIVKLQRLAPAGVNVYVKLESFNPMGSVKDRMARAVIERAEARGELRPGQTVIEATSGNTGIGLAMVCAQKGYPLVVTMAENFSVERRKLLRFLGAKVVLTPASEKGSGMLNKADRTGRAHGYYLCRQFENEANADAHTATTAQEILRDFEGERLDYWVTTFGTGGTLKGVARGLKAARPDTRVIAAEPDNAQVLGSHIPQPRDDNGKPRGSHPNFRPHVVQGTSPDFIAKLTQDAVAAGLVDEIVPVAGDDALRLARELATREGILVGISSGASLAAAMTIARRSPPGTNIVCMLADTGERYQSTVLFEHIGETMNAEELALSNSTPGCRFETKPAAAPQIAAIAERARAARCRRAAFRRRNRRNQTGRDVRAAVVRVLLGGAQVLRRHRRGVYQRRSRFGRVPARRARRQDPRGARATHRRADDPADLHRRHARGRLQRIVRSLFERHRAEAARRRRRRHAAEDRSVRLPAEMAAAASGRPCQRSRAMTLDTIPVIDLTRDGSPVTRAAIDAACREWGFFQIVGHGIDAQLLGALRRQVRAFFAQPVEAKRAVSRSEENPWGYYDRELTKNTRDWKEIFDFAAMSCGRSVPRWPADLPGFKETLVDYYRACETVAARLLRIISNNLGMAPDALDGYFARGHSSFTRLNHYPVCSNPARPAGLTTPTEGHLGVNHHTDPGAVTLLLQDEQPGLEVFRNGRWSLVEPMRDALVINVGDIVQVWSNDQYTAPLHRVVTNAQRREIQHRVLLLPELRQRLRAARVHRRRAPSRALSRHQLGAFLRDAHERRLRRPRRRNTDQSVPDLGSSNMAFIDTIHPRDSSGDVRAMYERQQTAWGYVPNYAKLFSHRLEVLAAWANMISVIRRPVDHRTFELVTFAAAHALGSSSCSLAHGKKLCERFLSPAEVAAIAAGARSRHDADHRGNRDGPLRAQAGAQLVRGRAGRHRCDAAERRRRRAHLRYRVHRSRACFLLRTWSKRSARVPTRRWRRCQPNLASTLAVGREVDQQVSEYVT